MRRFFLSILVAILTVSIMISQAEAKRFGGGKSFGYNRSFTHTNQASRISPAPTKPATSSNKWLGPLAGLAMGGLLASLFMGHGLGSGILSWLLIAGAIFLGWRLLTRARSLPRPEPRNAFQTESGRVVSDVAFNSNVSDTSTSHLASFNEADFLREAKTIFIRLQAAYDSKNLTDIREFTAPQVFAEVQMQLQERGDQENRTDVLTIDATLADINLESSNMTASVRFTGLIREQQDAQPENIKEIWHFTKDTYSKQWLVAGIQQEA